MHLYTRIAPGIRYRLGSPERSADRKTWDGMKTRCLATVNNSYSFSGKEIHDETYEGSLAFEARIFDSRLGKFMSLAPRMAEYAWQTPHACFKNSPIAVLQIAGIGGIYQEDGVNINNSVFTDFARTYLKIISANEYTYYFIDQLAGFANRSVPTAGDVDAQNYLNVSAHLAHMTYPGIKHKSVLVKHSAIDLTIWFVVQNYR